MLFRSSTTQLTEGPMAASTPKPVSDENRQPSTSKKPSKRMVRTQVEYYEDSQEEEEDDDDSVDESRQERRRGRSSCPVAVPVFNGEESFHVFKQLFTSTAQRRGWDEREKGERLQYALRKDAKKMLGYLNPKDWTFATLMKELENKYGETRSYADTQAVVSAMKREVGESLHDFACRIQTESRRTVMDETKRDWMCREAFVLGLTDYPDLRSYIDPKDKHKTTLQSAVNIGMKYEREHLVTSASRLSAQIDAARASRSTTVSQFQKNQKQQYGNQKDDEIQRMRDELATLREELRRLRQYKSFDRRHSGDRYGYNRSWSRDRRNDSYDRNKDYKQRQYDNSYDRHQRGEESRRFSNNRDYERRSRSWRPTETKYRDREEQQHESRKKVASIERPKKTKATKKMQHKTRESSPPEVVVHPPRDDDTSSTEQSERE